MQIQKSMIKKIIFALFGFLALWSSCVQNVYVQGEIYYNQYCSNCHGQDGEGLKLLVPPLKGSDYLNHPLHIACIIHKGKEGPITVAGKEYNQKMEGIPKLKETEIANIINYMVSKWGNPQNIVQLNSVMDELKKCE